MRPEGTRCRAVVPSARFQDILCPMAQSLANVVIHLIFSTKGRRPLFVKELREDMLSYIAATLNNHGCSTLQINGVDDHVHILFRMTRTLTISQIVEKVKTASTKAIKEKTAGDFAWQGGYAAYSVGIREVEQIRRYIINQRSIIGSSPFRMSYARSCKRKGSSLMKPFSGTSISCYSSRGGIASLQDAFPGRYPFPGRLLTRGPSGRSHAESIGTI